jgi:hypothetical protein
MYRIEWIWPLALLGAPAMLMVPFVGAMLAVVLIVAVALVALAGAIVATPFLLFRAVRRHESGRALPADTAQSNVKKVSLLTAVRERAATPKPTAAPVR